MRLFMQPVSVSDYRQLAQAKLPPAVFDFIDSGACDEITKRNNKAAFDNIRLKPLCLRDISNCCLKTQIFNQELSLPLFIAPTAFHQLLDKDGEMSTAKAARHLGIPMVVSCMSNQSLEDIALYSKHPTLCLQVYLFKNRTLTESLIKRAELAAYKAIIITVGVPVSGKRDKVIQHQFKLPPSLTTGNFESAVNKEFLYHVTNQELDPAMTWDDIAWIKSITKLPIILKGILNPLDAEKACQLQVAAIVVSNHGGRQLDTSIASIDALPDIIQVTDRRIPVLLDGGVERGTDIFKGIALGADALLIGRAVLWALAVHGEQGVSELLKMLHHEFELTMKLTGCRTIEEIKKMGPHLCCKQ